MIGLCQIEGASGDTGYLRCEELPKSRFYQAAARVNTVATLDGGSVMDHRGFSHTDRRFRIYARMTPTAAAALWALHVAGTYLYLTCLDGVYDGAIDHCEADVPDVYFTFAVREQKA